MTFRVSANGKWWLKEMIIAGYATKKSKVTSFGVQQWLKRAIKAFNLNLKRSWISTMSSSRLRRTTSSFQRSPNPMFLHIINLNLRKRSLRQKCKRRRKRLLSRTHSQLTAKIPSSAASSLIGSPGLCRPFLTSCSKRLPKKRSLTIEVYSTTSVASSNGVVS